MYILKLVASLLFRAELPTAPPTTMPTTTPTTTPTTQPTVSILKPTGPPQPLPEKLSELVIHIQRLEVKKDLGEKAARGFIPTNVNTYRVDDVQYFTIVYTYVGVSNVSLYRCFHQLRMKNVNDRIQARNWVPITVAPYDIRGEVRLFLVMKFSDEDRVLSMEKTTEEFNTERTTMRARGYEPVVVRYRLLEEGSSTVYTIYQKWAYGKLVLETSLASLRSLAYTQWSKKYYLVDMTYKTTKEGNQVYSAFFTGVPQTSRIIFLDARTDKSLFLSVYTAIHKAGYHVIAATPMVTQSSGTGYIAAYWR